MPGLPEERHLARRPVSEQEIGWAERAVQMFEQDQLEHGQSAQDQTAREQVRPAALSGQASGAAQALPVAVERRPAERATSSGK
jgi:hypothetical protein